MNVANPDRREFLQATGSLAVCSAVTAAPAPMQPPPKPWYQTAWRRTVIDMHIPDWDPQFLSKFDPDEYVARLVESRAQSVVCYAQSHVGLFNYPTKVGKQHSAFAGRDVVAELISRCRKQGIAVVLYTSLIHDRWAYDFHPVWRVLRADGKPISEGGRHGLVCPNSPYREYVRQWVDEIARRFDAEGFRFDMTFWVGVCHCRHCKDRWGGGPRLQFAHCATVGSTHPSPALQRGVADDFQNLEFLTETPVLGLLRGRDDFEKLLGSIRRDRQALLFRRSLGKLIAPDVDRSL